MFLNDNPDFVINVWNCRAQVCAWVREGDLWVLEPAANWEALEEQAIAAVEDQGGAINWSGGYYCPPELAAQGVWETDD